MDGRQNEQKGLLYTGMLGTLPEFIRKGYTLLGFYTEPDGGTRITEETDVPHEDTTYHAHWTPMSTVLRSIPSTPIAI